MLIVRCSHYTGKLRYEEISCAIYGPKMGKITSILMLACQIGAAFSYIVFIKTSVPYVIEQYTDDENITRWLGNNKMG
jgi:amino acid permease